MAYHQRREEPSRLVVTSDMLAKEWSPKSAYDMTQWKSKIGVAGCSAFTGANRSVHGLGKWYSKFRTGKFRPGMASPFVRTSSIYRKTTAKAWNCYLRWPTNVTAKTKYPPLNRKPHGKNKNLSAKPKTSLQKQNTSCTTKPKTSR